MPKKSPRATRIDAVKRLAKKIKRSRNIPHHQALDFASNEYGLASFRHTANQLDRNSLTSDSPKPNLVHTLSLSASWYDKTRNESGVEALDISLRLNDDFSVHSRRSGRVFYFRPGESTVRQGSKPFSSRECAIRHLVTYASRMLHMYPDHVTNRQSLWVQIQLHHRSVISARYYVKAPPKRKI